MLGFLGRVGLDASEIAGTVRGMEPAAVIGLVVVAVLAVVALNQRQHTKPCAHCTLLIPKAATRCPKCGGEL